MNSELGVIDAGVELGASVSDAELLGTVKMPARGLGAGHSNAEPLAI